jgi:hypothetical protein
MPWPGLGARPQQVRPRPRDHSVASPGRALEERVALVLRPDQDRAGRELAGARVRQVRDALGPHTACVREDGVEPLDPLARRGFALGRPQAAAAVLVRRIEQVAGHGVDVGIDEGAAPTLDPLRVGIVDPVVTHAARERELARVDGSGRAGVDPRIRSGRLRDARPARVRPRITRCRAREHADDEQTRPPSQHASTVAVPA